MSKVNRRDILKATALAGASAALLNPVSGLAAGAGQENTGLTPPQAPDLDFLRYSPLVNADRARFYMQQQGLDALVVCQPANVFYFSNHWPQLDRMGFADTAAVIFSRDATKPLALVMHAFSYYYTVSPEDGFEGRAIYPYTNPVASDSSDEGNEGQPKAAPARSFTVFDESLLSPLQRTRAAALANAQPASASPAWSIANALKDLQLDRGILGVDSPVLEAALRPVGIQAELRLAENLVRRIRLAKSPVEIQLMRIAAEANVQAGMAAIRAVREFETASELRRRFYSEAALRGNVGVFMVVNSSSSEVFDQPLQDGMAFSIDCVSSGHFYHGDFGRTVFLGEPPKKMQQSCAAIAQAWRDIQQQLRPGLRFADVPELGRESLRKQGVSLNVSFRPHSVGLYHTDHPQPSLMEPRTPEELVLEENMIISVDCPILEAGIGGTAHLEDLMLITASGAEAIHEVPDSVIVV
jgi:Xaa-Pro aminopeptidase